MQRRALVLVFAAPSILCAAWTVFAGKDVNWDLLNYHYYLPFELLHGRLQQDFYAASAQSYLNPVGYLPFYLLVESGWHSVIASMALAALHSLSIALLFLLAWRLFDHLAGRERAMFSLLAAGLGASTAVFWATVGGSFLDPLLVPFVLGGLLGLLDRSDHPVRRATLAGALFGAAAALKYSNVIFLLAALPLAFAPPGAQGRRLPALLGFAAGAAAAVALLAGPWLLLLAREFGNPVFPLMNGLFQSPHAPAVNLAGLRFTPEDAAAVLSFPFRMAVLDRALYVETFAPDLRFTALLAAAAALPVLRGRASARRALRGADWRVLTFFGLGALLWLLTSANGRYGMVILLLAGVCLARLGERLLPSPAARVVLGVLLCTQLAMSAVAAPSRWFLAEPWSKQWLPYEVPERARREPALYLTVEVLPMAVVAPFLHPQSALVNFRGQHSLPPDSPRLAALLERYHGRVRALGRGLELVDGRPRVEQREAYDSTLRRIGFRLDEADCFTIAWRPDADDLLSRAANRLARVSRTPEPLSAVSCALLPQAPDAALLEEERRVSALFDRVERQCAGLFRGQTAVTEPLGRGWSRHYAGLDARLEAFGGRLILNHYRSATHADLGRLSDWAPDMQKPPPACAEEKQ